MLVRHPILAPDTRSTQQWTKPASIKYLGGPGRKFCQLKFVLSVHEHFAVAVLWQMARMHVLCACTCAIYMNIVWMDISIRNVYWLRIEMGRSGSSRTHSAQHDTKESGKYNHLVTSTIHTKIGNSKRKISQTAEEKKKFGKYEKKKRNTMYELQQALLRISIFPKRPIIRISNVCDSLALNAILNMPKKAKKYIEK